MVGAVVKQEVDTTLPTEGVSSKILMSKFNAGQSGASLSLATNVAVLSRLESTGDSTWAGDTLTQPLSVSVPAANVAVVEPDDTVQRWVILRETLSINHATVPPAMGLNTLLAVTNRFNSASRKLKLTKPDRK